MMTLRLSIILSVILATTVQYGDAYCHSDLDCPGYNSICYNGRCYDPKSYGQDCEISKQCERRDPYSECKYNECKCKNGYELRYDHSWNPECKKIGTCNDSSECTGAQQCINGYCRSGLYIIGGMSFTTFLVICCTTGLIVGIIIFVLVRRHQRNQQIAQMRIRNMNQAASGQIVVLPPGPAPSEVSLYQSPPPSYEAATYNAPPPVAPGYVPSAYSPPPTSEYNKY